MWAYQSTDIFNYLHLGCPDSLSLAQKKHVMSSAALQEQENNQPLLTHVILTDSEDPEPIACFSVDTYRPTTTSLVLHHAYANRLPRAALVCQKVFALAAVTWDSAGCLEPLS